MSCTQEGETTLLKSKRSFDEVPIDFDWHDFLANLPQRGRAYGSGDKVRLQRSRSTGFQYECTTAGVTGNVEPRWPKVVDATVTDGSAVWTAKAMASTSLRTTISSEDYVADSGVTLGTESITDYVYRVLVDGGTDGQDYLIRHQIVCANGEEKEAAAILPVRD